MKKVICLLLLCILSVSLCGCNNSSSSTDVVDNDTEIVTDTEEDGTLVLDYTDSSLIATEEDIAQCKEYFSGIKVSLCDYSIFDHDIGVEYDYIISAPNEYPSEKGCSIVFVVDFGSRDMIEKFSPYLNLSIPNLSLEAGEGVTPSQSGWIVGDSIGIYFHRMNREVPIEDLRYTINSNFANLCLYGDFSSGVVGFDEVISLLKKYNNGDSVIQVIDGRGYILVEKESVDDTISLTTKDGKDKYYMTDSHIYIPITNGPEITIH